MDGLSGAAGVIGVVQIAGQIGSQIAKTRDFWQSVQEAPADVCAIILDLDLLSSVLASIAHAEQQHEGPTHPSTVNALKICLEKVRSFRTIADEFESGFQSDNRIKNKWSACKVVFKKEKLRKLRESLMETKATLALAGTYKQSYPTGFQHNQLYQRRPNDGTVQQIKLPPDINGICDNLQLLQVQLSAISTDALGIPRGLYNTFEDKLSSTGQGLSPNINDAGVVSDTVGASSKAVTNLRKSSEVYKIRLLFWLKLKSLLGRFDLTMTERRSKYFDQDRIERDVATSSLVYYPSSWLLKFGLKAGMEIALISSQRGWKFSLSPIRAVLDNSLVFRFCQSGNIEAIRELFSCGEASVYDVDSNGQTPLHYAVGKMHVRLSKFLISCGAEKQALSSSGLSPFHYIDISCQDSEAMLLLFDDCIDFSGYGVPQVYCFFLRQNKKLIFAPEKENPQYYYSSISWLARKFQRDEPDDKLTQSKFVFSTIFEYSGEISLEAVVRLLEMNPGVINDARDFSGLSIFHHLALSAGKFRSGNNSQVDLTKLVDMCGNLQQVCFGETPTSRSLWFSGMFGPWWSLLNSYFGKEVHAHWVRQTSRSGLPLKKDGWSPSTLQDLFNLPVHLKFRRTFRDAWDLHNTGLFGYCDGCQEIDVPVVIEPWFEDLKHRIKTESCICLIIANDVLPEYLEFEMDSSSNDDPGQADVRELTAETDGDSGTSPGLEGTPNCRSSGHQQHYRRPKVCLYCRWCRGNGPCDFMLNPRLGATETCRNNRACEDDITFASERAFPAKLSARFPPGLISTIRTGILTAFHNWQQSRWKNKYSSGSLYCAHCLADYEGWICEIKFEEPEEEVTHSMPGAFVE